MQEDREQEGNDVEESLTPQAGSVSKVWAATRAVAASNSSAGDLMIGILKRFVEGKRSMNR